LARIIAAIVAVLTFGIALQSLYTAGFGTFDPLYHRPLILLVAVVVVVFSRPLAAAHGRGDRRVEAALWAVDLALIAIIAFAVWRYILIREVLGEGIFTLEVLDEWTGILAMLVVLDLTRRLFGLPLTILGGLFVVYALFGASLPGFLRHAGYNIGDLATDVWFSTTGVFGLPMAVMLNLILVFIVFGVVLEGTGAGDVMLRMSFAATGRFRGGPAHAAIGSSAIFGSMSGSVIANVVGTGTFTIPMMIRRGFRRPFAGGVEAAASTGGQLMPPVMGAAAFLMAELTGTPYIHIATAAIIPALFYYASLFIAVVIESRRLGIAPIPPEQRVKLTRQDWILSSMFFVPILVVVLVMVDGRSPAQAGFLAALTTIVLSFLNPEMRRNPRVLLDVLMRAGRTCAAIVIAVASLGVIIAVLDLTGLGLAFAMKIVALGQDNLFLSLVVAMLGCIILGMGMPTLPAYLIIIMVMGPAMVKLGVPLIAIHMFVFYFGVTSAVTPPVAMAAYAAAPIAEASPIKVGMIGLRLSIVAFIIPFVFIYHPSILLILDDFDIVDLIGICLRMSLSVWMLTTGLAGMARITLPPWSQALRLVCGIAVLIDVTGVMAAGIAGALALIAHEWLGGRRDQGATPVAAAAESSDR